MDRDQHVDGGYLEDPHDSRIGRGDAEAAAGVGQGSRRSQQYTHSRRVEERALGQVDDDRIGDELRERLRQPGRRRKVEVAGDVQHGRTRAHRLAAHVKIAGRGHGSRV